MKNYHLKEKIIILFIINELINYIDLEPEILIYGSSIFLLVFCIKTFLKYISHL